MGLHAVSVPSPNTKNGFPFFARVTCPDNDLKNAVGRTIDHVSPDNINSRSKASFACWNASNGFCTQMAESNTICVTPAFLAAARTLRCAA